MMTGLPRQIAFEEWALEDRSDAAFEQSFAALVTRQSRFVFRVAYSVLRNTHDAEDAVQETFLKLYRGRKWIDVENERAFLARVAWRIAVDRRPRRNPAEPVLDLQSGEADPEHAAIAANRIEAVHGLIDALPDELRLPLALSTVDEMKSHEIAAVMGIPEGTVRSRLSRARQVLRQKLIALDAGSYGR